MPAALDPPETAAPAQEAARGARRRALADTRRALVLDAARAAFLEHGLEGTSMREIAKRAGYTVGAIYSYFASKEEVYGALLGESLERLNVGIATALAARPGVADAERLRITAEAFFAFYRDHPRDLDLGFYLFQGLQPRGLTPELDGRLNARLRDALVPAEQALRRLGLPADEAVAEVTALFAHTAGLLLLSHTGRIRMFQQDSGALFARYLAQLLARTAGGRRARGGAA